MERCVESRGGMIHRRDMPFGTRRNRETAPKGYPAPGAQVGDCESKFRAVSQRCSGSGVGGELR